MRNLIPSIEFLTLPYRENDMNEKVSIQIRVSYLDSNRDIFLEDMVVKCLVCLLCGCCGGGHCGSDALLSRLLVTLVDCHARGLYALLSCSLV